VARPVPPRKGSSPLGVAVPRPEFRGLSRRTIPTMDQLHRRLARLALPNSASTGVRTHRLRSLRIGPVLHPDDDVANKVCALYSRAQARDSSTSTPSSAPAATPATNCSRSRRSTTPAWTRTCSCWHSAPSGDFQWPSSSRKCREHRGPRTHRTNREMGGRTSESIVMHRILPSAA
jgi:hypothetical protein